MRVTSMAVSVGAVGVGAVGVAMHVTGSAVNVIVGLRRHQPYSTRVAVVSAVGGV
jgi:hypothetical protein